MGLIICPKHGESGFCMRFSKRVVELVKADQLLLDEMLIIFMIHLIDDNDGELLFSEQYLMLKQEFELMRSNNEVCVRTESQYDSIFKMLPELDGLCANCFKDYKAKHKTQMLGFN